MQLIQVLVDRLREFENETTVWRTIEEKKRSSYLEQPVAPTVEGGDDGGVDVAAIQTLEGRETVEQERKRDRERGHYTTVRKRQ